jgi:hypothetical protein
VTSLEHRAAAQLWQIAMAESVNPGARLPCLIAATLLADDAVPATPSDATPRRPDEVIRGALRQLAALPHTRFTPRVSTAMRHARQALLALDPPDADALVAG